LHPEKLMQIWGKGLLVDSETCSNLKLLLEPEATGAQNLDFSVYHRPTGRLIPEKKIQLPLLEPVTS